MIPVDLIIEARWVLPVVPRGLVLDHAAVVIRDGRIIDLQPIAEATIARIRAEFKF